MEALNFIKKTHKEYLDKSKIDNSVYDEDGHNYEYYYNKYNISKKLLELNTSTYPKYLYVLNDPIVDNLFVPIKFDKFNYINLRNYNLIFNDNFNNVDSISGKKITINGKMSNLDTITNFKELIINNEISINCLENIYNWHKRYKIIFNYPIYEEIKISCQPYFHFINNTNVNINIQIINNKFTTFDFKKDSKFVLEKNNELIKKYNKKNNRLIFI